MDQLRFFDHWLKGIDTGIMDEPPVKLMIRTGGGTEGVQVPLRERVADRPHAVDQDVPQGRTPRRRTRAASRRASSSPSRPQTKSAATYLASPPTACRHGLGGASVDAGCDRARPASRSSTAPLTEDTEVTGPIVLVLWVSSTSEDMDIFATIRNIGPDGKDVWEVGQQGVRRGAGGQGLAARLAPQARPEAIAALSAVSRARRAPVARSPARSSSATSRSGRPRWCSSKGHRIRLDVQPRDGVGASVYRHYPPDYNIGARNTVHAGGEQESYLLLPVIPPSELALRRRDRSLASPPGHVEETIYVKGHRIIEASATEALPRAGRSADRLAARISRSSCVSTGTVPHSGSALRGAGASDGGSCGCAMAGGACASAAQAARTLAVSVARSIVVPCSSTGKMIVFCSCTGYPAFGIGERDGDFRRLECRHAGSAAQGGVGSAVAGRRCAPRGLAFGPRGPGVQAAPARAARPCCMRSVPKRKPGANRSTSPRARPCRSN